MGLYLNQLPQTEVARLKAELAETLIAHFCYPRFYDYRVGSLRTRPVDRAKRQEVWQYLNAVDFNVWGRVDVDSPDFQRQVERLFIHFVQRNRCFFGEQGRRRMSDVRVLISSCSVALADGLRGHLRGQHGSPPFGSPRAVSSWAASNVTGQSEVSWEQIQAGTLLLQQQLQEARSEVRPTAAPAHPALPAPAPPARVGNGAVPSRRPRAPRPLANGVAGSGGAAREEDAPHWGTRPLGRPVEASPVVPSLTTAREKEFAQAEFASFAASADASPTMPLPLGKVESAPTSLQPVPVEVSPALPTRSRRSKPMEAISSVVPPSDSSLRRTSQPLPAPVAHQPASVPAIQATPKVVLKQAEHGATSVSDEDVVIFEQMRHQLAIWLRVEAVRAGIELGNQGVLQLLDLLRQQDSVDVSRLQVVSTLLKMCEQVISGGQATLFDYKQAMMFYLMHTRRSH